MEYHTLWKICLIPSVFGLAIKTYYGERKIWERLDKNFAFSELLDFIGKGTVSLMASPEASQQQEELSILTRSEIVKFCIQSVPSRDIGPQSAQFEVNEEMVDNLQRMMIQEEFFRNFRRFLVLTNEEEKTEREGIEFIPLQKSQA
ncbi:hypothetical protein BT96DRAFT_983466 [Gymnopus androsaceus JB14]|uniref:Uncharacterized protein n=1 Tax=Gymnopus androsaceus JB14 TaxID=1447944 RepID=A0A6A4IER3_9AGAR|nr:hypothetical protein BT96DRAFT_983466 [Gymnopus androsaceus JB14]